jgi:hypothetical protein
VFVSSRLDDPANGDNSIGIYLGPGAPPGTWTLKLSNTTATAATVHAWIERNDQRQGSFDGPGQNDDYSLGSLSCGQHSIAVGSYDAHKQSRPISYFSSAGPTRDGREKPEISAPGHEVRAAHSRTVTGVVDKWGTSMASPMVTGAVAALMSEALHAGTSLDISDIRGILQSTANPSTPAGGQPTWNNRYGAGRLNVKAAIAKFQSLNPAGGGGPAVA